MYGDSELLAVSVEAPRLLLSITQLAALQSAMLLSCKH